LNDGKGFFQFIKDLGTVYQSLPETDLGLEERIKVAEPYLRDYELKATEEEKETARKYEPKLYYLDGKDEGPTADGDKQQDAKDVDVEAPPEVEQSESETKVKAETEGLAAPDIPLPANPPKIPVTGQILHFSPSALNTLRPKAQPQPQAETGGSPKSHEYITTFDALSAHLLQRVYQARHRLHSRNPALGELGEVDILCPIDIRGILGLERDGEFYPYNAVFTTSSPFTHEELYPSSSSGASSEEEVGRLRNIASRIHEMVRPFRPTTSSSAQDQVQSTVEWIAAQPDRSLIKAPFRGSNASMMISQWNKLDMYPISDIEGGRRAGLVAPPFTPISLHDGLGYLVPSPPAPGEQGGGNGSGGIDVYLALRGDVWAELDVRVDGY
jgi:hypothetical protein